MRNLVSIFRQSKDPQKRKRPGQETSTASEKNEDHPKQFLQIIWCAAGNLEMPNLEADPN